MGTQCLQDPPEPPREGRTWSHLVQKQNGQNRMARYLPSSRCWPWAQPGALSFSSGPWLPGPPASCPPVPVLTSRPWLPWLLPGTDSCHSEVLPQGSQASPPLPRPPTPSPPLIPSLPSFSPPVPCPPHLPAETKGLPCQDPGHLSAQQGGRVFLQAPRGGQEGRGPHPEGRLVLVPSDCPSLQMQWL